MKNKIVWTGVIASMALLSSIPTSYASNNQSTSLTEGTQHYLNYNHFSSVINRYGRGNTFVIKDLPNTPLKSSLLTLSSKKQKKALKWLNKINFNQKDMHYLNIDNKGAIYFSEPKLSQLPPPPPRPPYSTRRKSVDLNNTFKLHSRLGSKNIVYLDFNGHSISQTGWNDTGDFIPIYQAKPFDTNHAPDSFSNEELIDITEMWRRVVEDYAPFDVDITTEAPNFFTPTTAHIVITEDIDKAGNYFPGNGSGGVAYVNVWGDPYFSYFSPALVFTNNLYKSPDYIAEAISHELGHNLGLSHDGTKQNSYYLGHGTGNVSWAPIMGMGYNQQLSQWSKGDYSDANNPEDDIAIISTKLSYSADDHSDSYTAATKLNVNESGVIMGNNQGIIGKTTDQDVFTFTAGTGLANIMIAPPYELKGTRGTNLDIKAFLFDASHTLIAESEQLNDTNAYFKQTLNEGVYYLTVAGTNNTSSPYSAYGSLGHYTISGILPATLTTDITPPSPVAWLTQPKLLQSGVITMQSTLAADESTVYYWFDCQSTPKTEQCSSTRWQTSTQYTIHTPQANTHYTFRVKAKDSNDNETAWSQAYSLTTVAANTAPETHFDIATVNTKQQVTIDVLANDSDAENDPLTIIAVKEAQKGTLRIKDNKVIYQAGTQSWDDRFTYVIQDSKGAQATGYVLVSISDTLPPSPELMQWQQAPILTTNTKQITMTAVTATDQTPVFYQFQCQSSRGDCTTSDWLPSVNYSFINALDNTTYRFKVRAKDSLGNTTQWSDEKKVETANHNTTSNLLTQGPRPNNNFGEKPSIKEENKTTEGGTLNQWLLLLLYGLARLKIKLSSRVDAT